ncbi:MAG: cytochrome c-type biogenesis protein CcmH [Candidatus Neomarinimicrobiota bacterium]
MNPTASALFLALSAGVTLGQVAPSETAIESKGKNDLQRRLEYEIMAPCCYGAPVGDHDSEAAIQVKAQIARLVGEGKTREEIRDMYVAIYGEQILAQPRARGFNLLAYIMPPAILLAGGLLLIYFINQIKTPAPRTSGPVRKSDSERFFERIEKEMQDLDI